MPNRFKGITELKSNEDYEKLVSEGSITDKDGVQYEYDQLGELYITEDHIEEELRGSITDLQNKVNSLESGSSNISENKLDKNLGAENSGKLLNVDSTGNITTLDNGIAGQVLTSNGGSQSPIWSNLDLPEQNVVSLTGTQEDPIVLYDDIEAGKIYFLSGYIKVVQPATAYSLPDSKPTIMCIGLWLNNEKTIEVRGVQFTSTGVYSQGWNFIQTITFHSSSSWGSNSYLSLNSINGTDTTALNVYAPTVSGTSGQILQSNGSDKAPTWIDLPNSGIEILTGTAESPINLYTDTEVGGLYSISGVVYHKPTTNSRFEIDISNSYLFFRKGDRTGYLIGYSVANGFNGGNDFIGGTRLTFSSLGSGDITVYSAFSTPNINGEYREVPYIYAPITSGTSGQVLQSNGEGVAPTWIDMPTSSTTEPSGTIITVGTETVNTLTFTSDPQSQLDTIKSTKVDKLTGKQLSTNDYTDEEKTKLQGIETGAEVNTIEQINVNGTNAQITNKTVNLNITDSSLIGNKINVSLNTSTYVMTISLLNSSDEVLSTADIDFPLESVIVNGSYSNGTLTLELQNGTTIPIDISSIVNGLVPTSRTINGKSLTNNITLTAEDVDALPSTTNIPSSTSDLTNDSNFVSDSSYVHTDNNYTTTEKNKLAGIEAGAQVNPTSLSELAEDSTHRLVSDTEKTTWNNKANSSDLTAKLNINQGNSNSGKILQVNSSGNIEPVNLNKKYLHRITLNLSDQPSGSPPSKTAIIHLDYYSEQSTTFTDVNFATIPYASPIGCTGYYLDTDVSLTQKNIAYEISIPEASTFVINGNGVTIQTQSTGSTIQDEILGYILID